MELETDELLLHECRRQIETKLGWEDGEKWSTRDFETLSHRIYDSTGVTLSIATLKRIWGKIKYDSKPTSTTLNTLARFLDHEDWRDFRKVKGLNGSHEQTTAATTAGPSAATVGVLHQRSLQAAIVGVLHQRSLLLIGSVLVLAAGLAAAWVFNGIGNRAYDPESFSFSSRKVVAEGVPNSVVFEYDASAASASDSVSIQQSWDKRLTTLVSRDNTQHTSIYYYPGFFEAKLVINKQIIKEHDLLITTAGWLTAIERAGVPLYMEQGDLDGNGKLHLPVEKIIATNIRMQPEPPFVGYHYFREFEGATSSDLIFESLVRNDYGKGSGACQYAEIRIQFTGPAVIIPLSIKGCVSNLSFAGLDGKKRDLSAFGRNMSEWVKVRCVLEKNSGELFLDDEPIMKFRIPGEQEDFVGLGFRFQGTGSVDDVKVSEKSGRIVFQDNFE